MQIVDIYITAGMGQNILTGEKKHMIWTSWGKTASFAVRIFMQKGKKEKKHSSVKFVCVFTNNAEFIKEIAYEIYTKSS